MARPGGPGRGRAGLAAALLTVLVASGCGGGASADDGFNGKALDNPLPVPDIALSDTSGNDFSLAADTDKRLSLVFFGYSNCPDICQTVMGQLAGAINRLDDADREQVEVIFVTTDPARDTETALRRYLDRFNPDFIGLTGDIDTIIDVGRPLAVYVNDGVELPTGGFDLGGHSTQITAIDSDDQAPVYWSQDTSQSEFADDIHTLLGEEP
ncbi:SCO family protein [Nocardioides psychrotolerans]|uniref:Protein SCO1/2 n=1 Tax=Nocardioides psychrotolerans TaxID=1005945 RepID=A0A1I3FLD0_9ACTN|nr:SCO family protein [Nocardioides psychrotolerans]GEP37193.1 SCO family protein [Nocardioides psychrotolerans]SFI11957.1 protein SCO1/2 [Nocardioides psychrotolerans]